MIRSLLRRLLYLVFLLWIVSIIIFWLSKQVPGDEVMDYISIDERGYNASINPSLQRSAYERVAHLRGLDLPQFYFSVLPGYIPDSVYHILPFSDRKNVKTWAYKRKNGQEAFRLYTQLKRGLIKYCDQGDALCAFYNQSLASENIQYIHDVASSMVDSLKSDSLASEKIIALSSIVNSTANILHNDEKQSGSFPRFRWNGTNNQYHRWISGLISSKPMPSLVDGRNAWSKIYDALKWTLLLNGFAFIVSMVLGVFIGIWSARYDGSRFEKIVNGILFALFALPSFWLGTLFIYFLSSGELLSIFPSGGLGSYQAADNFLERGMIITSHLFLPVLCLMLGSLAYVSRQMKQSVLHEYQQPYARMLRLQGISEQTILRKHIIKNALFPVITMIGNAIPALLSGSLVIEVLFSIPGMGRLMYNSLLARDWPVAFPILMFVAFITIVAYILTDVVYKWIDPRVKVLPKE